MFRIVLSNGKLTKSTRIGTNAQIQLHLKTINTTYKCTLFWTLGKVEFSLKGYKCKPMKSQGYFITFKKLQKILSTDANMGAQTRSEPYHPSILCQGTKTQR